MCTNLFSGRCRSCRGGQIQVLSDRFFPLDCNSRLFCDNRFLSAFGDADRKGWSAASLTAKAIALSVLAV
ncbi:hypothetical protein [Nostoc sp.]